MARISVVPFLWLKSLYLVLWLQHIYADAFARFPPFQRLRPDILIDIISQLKVCIFTYCTYTLHLYV